MRALDFVKVAASAEMLHIKRYVRRQGMRVGLAVVAVLFGLVLFVMLHALAIGLLMEAVRPWIAILVVIVVDLFAAGVMAMMAFSNKPDKIEREATAIRRQSLVEAQKAGARLASIGGVVRLLLVSDDRGPVNNLPNHRLSRIVNWAKRSK